MIISIAGQLGSGKSTIAKMLADILGYRHYSTGGFMRQMAEDRGVTLLELSKMAEKDYSIDHELDDYQIRLGKEEDGFVIDSRLGWHFIPNSFKVYLKVDPREAAKRIFKAAQSDQADQRTKEASVNNFNEAFNNLQRRRKSEDMRYSAIYSINQEDESNYDIVIDSSEIPPEKVVDIILSKMRK